MIFILLAKGSSSDAEDIAWSGVGVENHHQSDFAFEEDEDYEEEEQTTSMPAPIHPDFDFFR